jgi:Uma2 family endonuclease
MTDQATTPAQIDSVNEHISAEDYLANYAHDHYEWHEGALIKLSPTRGRHFELVMYLLDLFRTYFQYRPIGVVRGETFLLRVDSVGLMREPDIQIILNDNPGELTDTAMLGPADICVEVVSPESVERDYGTKFELYEKASVKEYWLLDYERKVSHFYRLDGAGKYSQQSIEGGVYETPLLPGLKIDVPVLWSVLLPPIGQIFESVRAMLGED